MNDLIDIVCLDAPAPPNYGGAIDMYFKIQSLAALGHRINLHYFGYRPGRDAEGLGEICHSITKYDRKSFFESYSRTIPYIVSSRMNPDIIKALNSDNNRILLEGLHCTGVVSSIKEPQRILVRMHNEEARYYNALAKLETNKVKKAFFRRESRLIKKYQQSLPSELKLASLATSDQTSLITDYGFKNTFLIPCFIPWQKVSGIEGKGNFCLYHGNLSVKENESAASWLVKEVFSGTSIPLVVAGSGASKSLAKQISKTKNCRLVQDPAAEDLKGLIRDAHVHVLPSFNSTGVKLKLLNALFNGRFCLANEAGVEGSMVSQGADVCNDASSFRKKVQELWEQEFTSVHRNEREYLASAYNNLENARRLSELW